MAELVLPSGAIKIIQTQQDMVGGTIAGGAAAVSTSDTDKNSELNILQQIKEVTLKSFRKTTEIAKTLVETLTFEKNQQRLERDAAAEIAKEEAAKKGGVVGTRNIVNETEGKFDGAAFALGAAVGPIFSFIKKIGTIFAPAFLGKLFGPLTKLFGKGGFLFRFLGPLGPIGLIIGGVALLFKYSDEIVKALTPAIDGIKKLAQENAPLITALKNGFDFLFKNIIGGIGRIIGGIIEDIGPLIGGFTKIIQGDIMGGLKLIGEGLINVILAVPRAIARFFEPVLTDIESAFVSGFNYVKTLFDDIVTSISNFANNVWTTITSIPGKVMAAITGLGSTIVSFFTETVPNMLKSAVNAMIDSLPLLPQTLKDKMKFDIKTPEQKEADNQISEFGTKEKYTDRGIIGGERMARGDGMATMDEAYNEVVGEQYTRARITKSGTSGYDQEVGILTPDQYQEYVKLDTDAQLQFLKTLDDKEQERRTMLFNLYEKKKNFKELSPGGYEEPFKDEFMSPDDQMLRDSKFQRQAKNQAKSLVGDGNTGGQTIIVNNQPTTVTSQNDIKKADMYSGNINTSSGDNYFERNIEGYA